MSIDAVVIAVFENTIDLVPRKDNPVGQMSMTVTNPDKYLPSLEGKEIWGGANSIMLGDKEIAKRVSYTEITMNEGWYK